MTFTHPISEAEHRKLQAEGKLICQCRRPLPIPARLFAAHECARCWKMVRR